MHSLVLDATGRRWFAVTGNSRYGGDIFPENQLVNGVSEETSYEMIDTAVPVELVFVGQFSGRLYYTSRVETDAKYLADLEKSRLVASYFNFYHTQLWTIQPDGSDERLLWESDDHAFVRVTETPDGDIFFLLIENDDALYEAIVAGVPEDALPDYFPHVNLMRLSPGAAAPEILLADIRDLKIWFPQD